MELFREYTRQLFGEERWLRYEESFNEPLPVSVRINPFKIQGIAELSLPFKEIVPWCRNAWYLSERPVFSLDPLLHSGAYYVQEASSMFLDEVLRQHLRLDLGMALDLCASPGGKSTLLRAALPDDALLYCNEPDHRRANILLENIQKQGHYNVVVTENVAANYRKAGFLFDVVLADVPCSGEGMFRKDEGARTEWSIGSVMKLQQLQRSIIADIWPCLRPGGLLIYSTCTFNTHENEENVKWITEEYDAELLPVNVKPEWGITGSLLSGWNGSVCRFIPGITRGEGLFMAALRKTGGETVSRKVKDSVLRILGNGHYEGTKKGRDVIPDHAEALLCNLDKGKYPQVELSSDEARSYLRGEIISLPTETPRGFIVVTYHGQALGFVKNIGNRANNLYPKEWRLRMH